MTEIRDFHDHLKATGRRKRWFIHQFWYRRGPLARGVAYILVVLAAMVALTTYENRRDAKDSNAIHAAIERERTAALVSCHRVQILRDQANGLTFLTYHNAEENEKRVKQLLKDGALGPLSSEYKRSVERSKRLRKQMVVTGPTDCVQAVDRPDTYRPPAPEFIYKNGPHVQIAEKRSQEIIRRARESKPLYDPIKPNTSVPTP